MTRQIQNELSFGGFLRSSWNLIFSWSDGICRFNLSLHAKTLGGRWKSCMAFVSEFGHAEQSRNRFKHCHLNLHDLDNFDSSSSSSPSQSTILWAPTNCFPLAAGPKLIVVLLVSQIDNWWYSPFSCLAIVFAFVRPSTATLNWIPSSVDLRKFILDRVCFESERRQTRHNFPRYRSLDIGTVKRSNFMSSHWE